MKKMLKTCILLGFFLCIFNAAIFAIDDNGVLGYLSPDEQRKELFTTPNYNQYKESSSANKAENKQEKDQARYEILLATLAEILRNYPKEVSVKIRRIIRRLCDAECPIHIKPKKMLMVGPSGVGKTTLAKGIATLAGRHHVLIRAPQLLTRFQHSGAENITSAIKEVLALNRPYVIIVDEINALFDRFNDEHQADKETAMALWLALDECAEREDIYFIGIANEIKNIPDQLKTRFANDMFEIPLPDFYARKRIIRFYLKQVRNGVTNEMLNDLSEKTDGMSARELEDMVNKAIERAYDRNSVKTKVRICDLEAALADVRPYGKVITTIKKIWDNKKEIVKEAGPYITVAGFGLNVVQAIMNEANFLAQHELGKLGHELAKDNYSLSKKGHTLQQQAHDLSKESFAFQKQSHKESHDLQKDSYALQKTGNKMQKDSLDWVIYDHSLEGRVINFISSGAWLSLLGAKK
jgi:AAA+ superfamily predicted ATPase